MYKPVSFNIAKLLKEKGYIQLYEVGKICRIQNVANLYYEETRLIKESDIENSWTIFNEIYPTIAEVVMWLYEKHGFWIEVQCPDVPYELWSYTIHKPHKCGNYGSQNSLNTFNSPTEAYEIAIEDVLNNLI